MKFWIIILLIVLSLIGLSDSAFLTSSHYSGSTVTCSIGGNTIGDCNSVLTSKYAKTAGVPNSLVGVVYYFIALILSAFLLTKPKRATAQLLALLTGVGFLASLWFVYLQLFVLNAICVYCMVSAATTALLFIFSLLLLKRRKLSV